MDRVPISTYELNPWKKSNFENQQPSYARLMEFIRQHADCLYYEPIWVPNACHWEQSAKHWDEGDQRVTRLTLHTPTRTLTQVTSQSDNVMTVWNREALLKDLDDLEAYLSLPWQPGEPDFGPLNEAWKSLDGRHGLPMIDICTPLGELATSFFDMADFLVLAITETNAIIRAIDILHERKVEFVRRMLKGPVKNTVCRITGSEVVTPPLLPPELFARLVTPYESVYMDMMRDAGVYPRLHIHGKIARVLDEIIKLDPAAIDPLETPPDGDIGIADLKKRIGKRICLMGGVELRYLEATDEAFVERLTRNLMAQGKPGGRFVIMPTAAPINIPLSPQTEKNYIRWIETALEVGKY